MPKNQDLVVATMSRNSVLLGALSHALSLDLGVVPLVLATEIGIGTGTAVSGIAKALHMEYVDVRCAQIADADSALFQQSVMAVFAKDRPVLVLLDEATSGPQDAVEAILMAISEAATSPVIVALTVRLDDEDEAIEMAGRALGIHRALVPSARLAVSQSPKQPILVTGLLSLEGSKRFERYFEIETSNLTESRIRFTLNASGDQGDDELNEFLHGFKAGGDVAVRLESTRHGLTCTTADMASFK